MLLLLLLLLLALLTLPKAITALPPLPTPISITSPNFIPSNLSSLRPLTVRPEPHRRLCTPWQNWTASYVETDCWTALDIFFEDQVKPREPQRRLYEFVTRGDRPVGRDQPVWLPAAVEYQTCTLSFILLRSIRGRPLPHEPAHPKPSYQRTDTTSFWDIYEAARAVLGGCMSTLEQAGWGTVGEDNSIGVFIWGTRSIMASKNFPG